MKRWYGVGYVLLFIGMLFCSYMAMAQDKSATPIDRKIQLRFPVDADRTLAVLVMVGEKESDIQVSPRIENGKVTGVVLASEGIDYRVRVDKDSLIYELTAGNLTVGRSFVVNDVNNRPLFQFSLQDKQPPPPPPGPTPQVAKPGEGTDEAIQDILKPKDKDKDKPKP